MTLLLSGCCSYYLLGNSAESFVSLRFFSEELQIAFDPSMMPKTQAKVDDRSLKNFYDLLLASNHKPLLSDLLEKKEKLRLNDWLFFLLLKKSVGQIFSQRSEVERELVCWFLLSQSGFDTRLAYKDKQVFVYVFSKDEVFEVPLIDEKGKVYVNLTGIYVANRPASLYLLDFAPNANGKPFSFYLNQAPVLRAQPVEKEITFTYRKQNYLFTVQYDQTLADIMKGYPLIDELQYVQFALSPTLAASLLPQLRAAIEGKNEIETLEFLAAFTRSGFPYQEDKAYFGKSKPMVCDELFYYSHSDCEDRVALYYGLVKELLDLPMIVIAYNDHLSLGVATHSAINGDTIEYNQKRYYICDPTGPVNSAAIGSFPTGYEVKPFEIIGSYK